MRMTEEKYYKISLLEKIVSVLVSIPALVIIFAILISLVGFGDISYLISVVMIFMAMFWLPPTLIGLYYLLIKKIRFVEENNFSYTYILKNSIVFKLYLIAIILFLATIFFSFLSNVSNINNITEYQDFKFVLDEMVSNSPEITDFDCTNTNNYYLQCTFFTTLAESELGPSYIGEKISFIKKKGFLIKLNRLNFKTKTNSQINCVKHYVDFKSNAYKTIYNENKVKYSCLYPRTLDKEYKLVAPYIEKMILNDSKLKGFSCFSDKFCADTILITTNLICDEDIFDYIKTKIPYIEEIRNNLATKTNTTIKFGNRITCIIYNTTINSENYLDVFNDSSGLKCEINRWCLNIINKINSTNFSNDNINSINLYDKNQIAINITLNESISKNLTQDENLQNITIQDNDENIIEETNNEINNIELEYIPVKKDEIIIPKSSPYSNYNKVMGRDFSQNLVGTKGNDIIFGGKHDDTLTGGEGSDIFYYRINFMSSGDDLCDGKDIITDFELGVDEIYIGDKGSMMMGLNTFLNYEKTYYGMKANGNNSFNIHFAKTYQGNSKDITGWCDLTIYFANEDYNYLNYFDPTWGNFLNSNSFKELFGDSFKVEINIDDVFKEFD